MKQLGSILIVDDNPDILIAARLLLKQQYQSVKTTGNPFDIEGIINQQKGTNQAIDIILLDMNFSQDAISGQEGFYWLKKIIAQQPSIAVLLMTAFSDISLAVEAIKLGASDFISKPWQNEQLLGAVAAAFSHAKDKKQVSLLTRKTQGLSQALNQTFSRQAFSFLGQSPAMTDVFKTIEKVAKTDVNILITGESGTGKELAAHAIHHASTRCDNTFISLDMGAVTQSLFESELFGHKKGAFTDAKNDRIGKFELAHNGSLFLDELANLPLEQQAKLLAILQNRKVTPLGSNTSSEVNIRLICATNENLQQAVAQGRFRQDLLYRINTIEIRLPPLRDRIEDIPLLANYYLKHFAKKYKRELDMTPNDINLLCEYTWPGNVRELAHAIERAVVLSEGSHLDISSVVGNDTNKMNDVNDSKKITDTINVSYDTFDLNILEQRAVGAALKHYQGNVSHAAKALGLTRGAMYRRLEKYGL